MGELKISRKIDTTNPMSTYEVSVRYMHGDADKYETEIVFIKDKDVALEFVEAINEITKNRNKKRERTTWAKKYPHFFDEECTIDDAKYEDTYLTWPGDCTVNGMYSAAIESCQIFYFDEDGIKFEVEYVGEE